MMDKSVLTLEQIKRIVMPIAEKYRVEAVYLFGSYARGEADGDSDLDFLVFGGDHFKLTMILAMQEEFYETFRKKIDAFEIREINEGSPFYNTIMKEKVLVA